MVQAVALPDGNLVNFPDEMSQEDISKAMPQAYAQYQQTQQQAQEPKEEGVSGFVSRTGRYETQALKQAGEDLKGVVSPYKRDSSPGPDWLQGIGQYAGGVISGVGGAVTSPVNSTISAAVEPQTSKFLPQTAPQDQKDAMAQAVGGTVGNVGMALLGARSSGIAPEIDEMGKALKPVAQIGKRAANAVGENIPLVKGEGSGPPQTAPLDTGFNDVLQKASKNTRGQPAPDTHTSGMKAINALNKNFDIDKTSQKTAYTDLDAKGSTLSIKAPDLYKKSDDLMNYLQDKIAPGTDENVAYTELKEVLGNLKEKYGLDAKPEKTSSILDANGKPIVTQPAEAGVNAYGVQPSDLVDIKTSINGLLNTNKFTTAGKAKLIQFKEYVQQSLDDASKISPEFGQSLKTAEDSAVKVSGYRRPELSSMWQPEDHVSWKAAENDKAVNQGKTDLPGKTPGTDSRAEQFLDSLNNGDMGRISALVKVLPKEDAVSVLHDAVLNAKDKSSIFANILWQLRNASHAHDVSQAATGTLNPLKGPAPLLDIVKRAQPTSNLKQVAPAIGAGTAAAVAGTASNKYNDIAHELLDKLFGNKNLTNDSSKSKIQSPQKPQSSNERDTNGFTSNSANGPAGKLSGKFGQSNASRALPNGADSKKNSNVDTSSLVDNLGIKDDTTKALAKSNADSILKVAQQTGEDPVHLLKMASSESRMGTNTGAGNKGLFQITDNSFKLLKEKYPDEMKDLKRQNPEDNTKMAILLAKSDAQDFRRSTGQDPSPEEKRLLHVLGLGATLTLADNSGKHIAARTLSNSLQKAAESNRNLFVTKDNKNVSPALLKKNILNDYNKWDKYIRTGPASVENDMEPMSD